MLTPKLTDILARVPLEKLKQLAGATSIELLNSLKPQAVSQPGLAEFLVHTSGEAAALTDPAIRDAVIDHLHGPEAVEICQILKAPTADPISTLRGAIKSPAKFEKFLTYFSLSLSSSFADEPVPASFRATPESNLRPHQTTSYRRLRRALNPPNRKILVHMPYGAGKLRMVAVTAADLFRAEPDDMVVLWFSSGAQLCEESFEELVRAWENVGTQPVTVTRAFGKDRLPDLANVVDGIFVFDVEQFVSEFDPTDPQLSALATRTSLVVLHDASLLDIPQFAATFDAMDRAGDLKVVGICTSGENGLQAIGRSSFLRLFDETVGLGGEGSPIEYLRQAREIDGLQLEIFRPRIAYAVPTNADFDVSADDHVRLAENVGRNAELIDRIVTELADNGSVVFFASTADQAKTFSGILSFYGGTAITVTSEMPRDARLQQVIRFQQQDDAQVLCVHDVLISGKDVPKVTTVIISTPILSSTKLSETFGRLASGRSGASGMMKLIVVDDGIPGYPDLVQATTHWSESTP